MNKEQIKQYYEIIEKLLNGANKETYGFVPEEIKQILKWYEVLQQENKKTKDRINKAIEYLSLYAGYDNNFCLDYHDINGLLEILQGKTSEN